VVTEPVRLATIFNGFLNYYKESYILNTYAKLIWLSNQLFSASPSGYFGSIEGINSPIVCGVFQDYPTLRSSGKTKENQGKPVFVDWSWM